MRSKAMQIMDYFGPVILITCLNNVFGVSVPCKEKYLAKNGRRCYPCSAGYYKVSDCDIDGKLSRCRPCGNGEYLPKCDNSTQCKVCDLTCHGGQIEIKACTTTSNLQCQCKVGYYWKTDPHRICTRHRKCIPGEGVKAKGTPHDDTICEPCKNGTSYSNLTSFNECTPCSVCNTTQRSCNNTHDTVCGSKAEGTTNTPEGDSDMTLVAVLVPVFIVLISVCVIVGVLFRRKQNQNSGISQSTDICQPNNTSQPNGTSQSTDTSQSNSTSQSTDTSKTNGTSQSVDANQPNGTSQSNGTSQPSDTTQPTDTLQPTKTSQSTVTCSPNLSKTQQTGIDSRRVRNDTTKPTRCSESKSSIHTSPSNKPRDEAFLKTSTELEGKQSLKFHDENDKCCIDMTINNVAYSSGSKAADQSVQKGSLTGHANDEGSTQRINANEINKNFDNLEKKKFEPDNKTDKPDRIIQISVNIDNNIYWAHIVNVIGAINNDDSKANGTLSHTSIDAGKTNGPDHINTAETGRTTSFETVTSIQSDGNGQSNYGNWTVSYDKHWFEVFNFMSEQFIWDKFKHFYRRLIVETNDKVFSTVDADIENTRQECPFIKEAMYRLMNIWKQRNPNGTMLSIAEALDKCGEKLMSEKLMSFINTHTKTDKVIGALKSDIVPYMGERYARGELSTSVLTVDNEGIV